MKQNKFYLLLVVALSVFTFSACSSDDDNDAPTPKYEDYIDSDTEAILTKLEFTVHKGNTPPQITGTYFGETIKVTKSTLAYDFMKDYDKVGEMTYHFFDQKANNTISSKLSMLYTYSILETTEEYSGVGTLVSGSGDNFTVFSTYDGVLHSGAGDAKAKLLYLISGTVVKDAESNITALKDLSSILLMVDDYGDPLNVLINNGTARKFVSMQDALKID